MQKQNLFGKFMSREVFSMNNMRRTIKKTYLHETSFAVAVDARRPGQLAAGPEGACVP